MIVEIVCLASHFQIVVDKEVILLPFQDEDDKSTFEEEGMKKRDLQTLFEFGLESFQSLEKRATKISYVLKKEMRWRNEAIVASAK